MKKNALIATIVLAVIVIGIVLFAKKGNFKMSPANEDDGIIINVGDGNKAGVSSENKNNVTTPPTLPNDKVNTKSVSESLIINKNFGSLSVNRVLGQEYVEREYHSFPLLSMVKSDAIKYGQEVGINAVIIKFNQNASQLLPQILSVYTDLDWRKENLPTMNVYDIYQINNPKNRIALWVSNSYLVLIHSSDGFHGDSENLTKAYLEKYPSNQ